MNILIIGNGGREHALAWKVAQSARVQSVFVAPGNGGTSHEPKVRNVPIDPLSIDELVAFATEKAIDLTIVGPENALAAGVVDAFTQHGLRCFGPTQAAAQLESSKAFAKDFLARHSIPTARYQVFEDPIHAKTYLYTHPMPVVIKADGLAAGKGVIICETLEDALKAVDDFLVKRTLGKSSEQIIIEEFLQGEEASFIVLVDGKNVLPLATSQDHKRLLDNDLGPNTGGMGAYSPAPVVTPAVHERVMKRIVRPTIAGMTQDGNPFCGFLYVGLMIDPEGNSKVLEFNCRLGDPETQPLMMRLESDLVSLCEAALDKKLHLAEVNWSSNASVGIVMAAKGYPQEPQKGDVIKGLPKDTSNVKVFHAGTAYKDGQWLTAGGRVLCVTALGNTILEAQQQAYRTVDQISWDGAQYRKDIGARGVHPMP